MSKVTIRIPTPLRAYTDGADEIQVEATSVALAMQALGARHREALERILTAEGEPRQFVNVYLGSKNIRAAQGMQTPLQEGDVISIIPAVAGGKRR